jgi:hypothetical protein
MLCVFLWAKWLNAKDIHKQMFYVCGGKCCRVKTSVSVLVEDMSRNKCSFFQVRISHVYVTNIYICDLLTESLV